MTLLELIEGGYQKDNDLNCAEAIFLGANKVYQLGLGSESLKLAAGFGGGLCTEDACGVVTGMVMVLSHLYANERGHKSPEMKAKIQEAIKAFEVQFNTTNCKDLKAKYRTEEKGCHDLIVAGAKILDSIHKS